MSDETKDVLLRLPPELVEWLDVEAAKRDRSRSWMLAEAVKQWKGRLERERERRAMKRRRAR